MNLKRINCKIQNIYLMLTQFTLKEEKEVNLKWELKASFLGRFQKLLTIYFSQSGEYMMM